MDAAVFSSRPYDRDALTACLRERAGADDLELHFYDAPLSAETVNLVARDTAACVFVNDRVDAGVIEHLAERGCPGVVTRSAGFNHIDLDAAQRHDLPVLRVPAYGPHGVAEHALALMMTLNRRTHRAYNRVREGNFRLDGLMGFQMHGKTVGVVGTGLIGAAVCRVLRGMGCAVLAYDTLPNPELESIGVAYCSLPELWPRCRVVTLHCPLNQHTHHLVDSETIAQMPNDAMLINTSRGGLVDTGAAYVALRQRRLGALGIDVYEEEEGLFFEDGSDDGLTDDLLARLVALPNVLITGHQAFFTREAIDNIAEATIENLRLLSDDEPVATDHPHRVHR